MTLGILFLKNIISPKNEKILAEVIAYIKPKLESQLKNRRAKIKLEIAKITLAKVIF